MNSPIRFQSSSLTPRRGIAAVARVATAALLLCMNASVGLAITDEDAPDPLLATEKLLTVPVPANFDGTRLQGAIDSLGAASGLTIHVDWDELRTLGVVPEKQVTLKAGVLPVGEALAQVIAVAGAKVQPRYAVVREGIVEISSPSRIAFLTTETRVYDISDLVGENDITVGSGANPRSKTKTVVDAIVSKVGAPGDWEANAGTVSSLDIIQSKLFIRTPRENQAAVARVLASLRAPRIKDPKPDARSIGTRTRGADTDSNSPSPVAKTPVVPSRPAAPPVVRNVEKTINLQPANGHDVYVIRTGSKPSRNQLHQTPELPIGIWTVGGEPCDIRSFIKFDELSQIPKNARIVSANLCLTGAPSSLVMPQGDSQYPGSPNSQTPDNICVVERVIEHDWDESTLTYDNQPASTKTDQAVIPSSNSRWRFDAAVDVTAQVQEMVADPKKNYGFVIKMKNEGTYRSMVFVSSASKLESPRPKLVVVYQTKVGG